ncbi:MAG: VCBS repeat-containing protein [Myxococcales bacterium]|nr:VCBS repeat-containing protein [Myxococcales bacterium]
MDWPKLDTRWWNLSLGVVATTAMAACGPTILLDDEDSITDSDSDTDGPDTTNPPDTTDPPPEACQFDIDCEPGEVCIDGACMPDEYYCSDGGCCYEYCCYDDCCYGECYYNQCYSDEECSVGELCNYGNCEVVEGLPACEEPSLAPLLLPVEDEAPIVSLSFVDGDGDEAQDLLVGRTNGARLHLGTDQAIDLPLPQGSEVVIDAVSADFDNDGDPDLALVDGDDSLTILLSDGAGGYTLGSVTGLGAGIVDLMALQWDSDGAVDLAGLTSIGTAVLHQGDGAGGMMATYTLHGDGNNLALATGRFNPDELGDLVAQDTDETMLFFGNDQANVSIAGALPEWDSWSYPSGRRLLAGDIDGSGLSEIVGSSNRWGGWVLLEAWPDGGQDFPRRYAIYDEADHSAMSDFDGDGRLDVVMATSDRLVFVRGGDLPQLLDCQSEAAIGTLIEHLALGDFDGDGRAEVVVSNGSTLQVLVIQ